MLILVRKAGQKLRARTDDGTLITVKVLSVERDRVKLGIDAPDSTELWRAELDGERGLAEDSA